MRERGRIDLGGLVIRGVPGLKVQLEVRKSGPIAVTLTLGDSSLQLQAFTARTESSRWQTVRAEILEGLRDAGRASEGIHGCLGAAVVACGGVGKSPRPVRFVGCDGPGWLLRGLCSGPVALDQGAADVFERMFRDSIVVAAGQSRAERTPFILRPRTWTGRGCSPRRNARPRVRGNDRPGLSIDETKQLDRLITLAKT